VQNFKKTPRGTEFSPAKGNRVEIGHLLNRALMFRRRRIKFVILGCFLGKDVIDGCAKVLKIFTTGNFKYVSFVQEFADFKIFHWILTSD
jgi:hypothetical protein